MRTTLFTLASCAVASVSAFAYADVAPLLSRQEPGTPQYECHADCGGIITLSRTPDYCSLENFTTTLTDCLECALEFDIWTIYGDSVTEAAQACGLDATPVPVNGSDTATSTTAGGADPTETPSDATETAATSEPTATESPSETPVEEPSATETAAEESESATESSSTGPAQSTGGASTLALSGGLAMIPIGLAAVALL